MKKLTLFAIALLASIASFAALNPFAYGLSSNLSDDGLTLTVNYSLNAAATDVSVVILDGETKVKTIICDGITKGSHSVEISTIGLPTNKSLTWKVEVTSKSVAAPTPHATTYSFFHPSSVDIDNNPENETFGLILANEAMHSIKGNDNKTEYKNYLSYNIGAGIFAFTPDFEPIKNTSGTYGYNGGIKFTNTRADGTGTAYAPRRIRISEDGRIFVTSLNTDGNYLWEVNPENMNEWTPIFKGTLNDQRELVDAEGNFVAAPNAGFDVKGSGENLQLAMYSVNLNGITASAMGGFRLHEYNLGTATEWTTAPSKNLVAGKYAINYTGTQVEYDNEGGFWIASYRGTASDVNPGLVHINAEGVEDAKFVWNNVRQAGIRFNKDFTKLVVAGYNGAAKKATIYTISKDANGAPVLTQEAVVDMSAVGNNLNDFAWDYAGNLYSCGNSSEKIAAWAMPYSGTVATPAASKYAFKIGAKSYTVIATANDTAMGTITVAGTCYEGENVTLTATANKGYEFVNWTKGEEIVSTENPYTFKVTTDVALVANFQESEPEIIIWELNDGEILVEVPTNEELWEAFKPYYNTFYGEARADQPITAVATFMTKGEKLLTDETSEYKWLGDYLLKVTNEQIADGTLKTYTGITTEVKWRFATQAFFNCSAAKDADYSGNADFTEAGKPENWGAAYQTAHEVVLPTEPVEVDYTLPTPVKSGYTFIGWYNNAEGTGTAMTVLPAGWSGTLYAIWKVQGDGTALENTQVSAKAVKVLRDNQVLIIRDGKTYNMMGQEVK